MQHHDCSISRPQFYDNHMKCIHVSIELPNNVQMGLFAALHFRRPNSSMLHNIMKLLQTELFENFDLVYNMYYFATLTQFNCYLRIQVSSYKKTDPKYPNI